MPSITFQYADGSSRMVPASIGSSVMQAAKAASVEGIIAECGGEMVCATCHVYVLETALAERLPPPSPIENDMLDFTSEPRREHSRLSCQIRITDEIDGLVVEIPRSQV